MIQLVKPLPHFYRTYGTGMYSMHSYQDRTYLANGQVNKWDLQSTIDFNTNFQNKNQKRCTTIKVETQLNNPVPLGEGSVVQGHPFILCKHLYTDHGCPGHMTYIPEAETCFGLAYSGPNVTPPQYSCIKRFGLGSKPAELGTVWVFD